MIPRINYEIIGAGASTLVICNGLSQSTANWRGIARSNPDYRWVLFDARGCGKSPLGPKPYTIDSHVDDLLWVLDQAAVDKPYILGFSHGGRVACRAAAQNPHRFKGMVLVSVGSEMTISRKAYVASWHNTLRLGGIRAMAWATLPSIVGRKILERFNDWEMLVNGTANRNTEEGLLAMFEGMAQYPPIEHDARQVTIPTLVLRGGEDPLLGPKDSFELATWTHGQEVLFEDCGHTLPLEESVLFMEAISRWLTCVEMNSDSPIREN